jgi:hypothetical protein
MKKINLLFIFIILFVLNVSAQNKASTFYKGTTTICSLVSEGDGGRAAKDAPLILYMQDSVQNKRIEIVFSKLMRSKMSYNPYDKLVNQTVCITGKISEYKNAPAIIISNENQIKTESGEQVNRMTANH